MKASHLMALLAKVPPQTDVYIENLPMRARGTIVESRSLFMDDEVAVIGVSGENHETEITL